MSGYRDVKNQVLNKIRVNTPLVIFKTFDFQAPKRLLKRLNTSDEDLGNTAHILLNTDSTEVLTENNEWVDAERHLTEDNEEEEEAGMFGGGGGGGMGGGGQFVDTDLVPDNSVVLYQNLYRMWAEGDRLDNRTANQLQNYFEYSREHNIVNLIYQPIDELPTDDGSLYDKVEYLFPDEDELRLILKDFLENQKKEQRYTHFLKAFADDKIDVDKMLEEATGMTAPQFHDALKEMSVKERTDSKFMREKLIYYTRISGASTVAFHEDLPAREDVGGLNTIKEWTIKRKPLFLEPEKHGDVPPKGILMVGPPGTGKSFVTKYIAGEYGVPLIEVKTDKLISKYQGESQKNMRKALNIAESIAPCVLFFDEIEKLFGGTGSGGDDGGGGGSTEQMLGMLLGWMNDNDEPIFCSMTCNDLEGLPPELKRRGRLDRIFAVGLPGLEEKIDLIKISMRSKGIPTDIIPEDNEEELERFDKATDRQSKAECTAIIKDALTMVDGNPEEVDWDTVVEAAKGVQAIAKLEYKDVEETIEWCKKYGTWAD